MTAKDKSGNISKGTEVTIPKISTTTNNNSSGNGNLPAAGEASSSGLTGLGLLMSSLFGGLLFWRRKK